MADEREQQQAEGNARQTQSRESDRQTRDRAEKRAREARKQMTPDADVDDTVEGEGSPGLTIVGGGGHA